MPTVILACVLLVVATTVLHYEALRLLNAGLPRLPIPSRSKLIVVMLVAFTAHALEIGLYGGSYCLLAGPLGAGALSGGDAGVSLSSCLYFSGETYTSLGYGDLIPKGPLRLLAGIEALNGLLLIGWTASFTYLCMERFWTGGPREDAADT
jgi:hypothetical protein